MELQCRGSGKCTKTESTSKMIVVDDGEKEREPDGKDLTSKPAHTHTQRSLSRTLSPLALSLSRTLSGFRCDRLVIVVRRSSFVVPPSPSHFRPHILG